ncbi:MAG: ABC transporter substrate-binding protein, partial [Chloroflexota bacterium]
DEAYALWEDRSLDFAPLPSLNREDVLENSPLKVTMVTEPSIFYLAFNHESELFSRPELRRAFAAAIDREEIIEQVLNELGVPARHLSPPGVYGSPPFDQVGVGYNPDYARLQLIQAGVTACRFLPPIRYMVNSSDASLFQAELVREMWVEELGCPEDLIIIEQVPFGELLAATHAGAGENRPDVWDLGWEGDYPDAHDWLTQLLHCEESDRRLQRSCDVIDNDILISGILNENERQSAYRSIETRLFGEDGLMPVAPIYVSANYFVRQTWVDIRPSIGLEGVYHYNYLPLDAFFVDAELKAIEQGQ